jgi:hypothetical protein
LELRNIGDLCSCVGAVESIGAIVESVGTELWRPGAIVESIGIVADNNIKR